MDIDPSSSYLQNTFASNSQSPPGTGVLQAKLPAMPLTNLLSPMEPTSPQQSMPSIGSPSPSISSSGPGSINTRPQQIPTLPTMMGSSDRLVNMRHMELLSHFILETSLILGPAHSSATRMSLAITLSTPYLINQVLALSALHLRYLYPAKAQEYASEAAMFQANSLSSFNSLNISVNKENCVPMLLFSALVGIYTLAEAVIASDGNDHSNFLDKYIKYLDVHRGVNAVIDPFWDYLRQTELAPFLNTAAHLERSNNSHNEILAVCARLEKLLDNADMRESSLVACRAAVQHLKWALGLLSYTQGLDQPATADTIYSWPILLSADFTALLAKRRPEALIILAHYAVVLHERRDVWVVGNAGSWLIKAITVHLGTYWKEWLEWPNNALLHATRPGSTLFLSTGGAQ